MIQPAVAQAETLDDAVKAALVSQPALESAKAEADAAGQARKAERSNYFPQISTEFTSGRIYGDNATSRGLSVTRGAGYSWLGEGSISAREKIFDGFETKNRVDSATSKKLSADMSVLDARDTTIFHTVQAYLDLLRAREGLEKLKGYGKKLDDYQGRIKKAVDSGSSDEAEYQQARDVHVILDGLVADYEGQVRIAESNYFNVTGTLPEGTLAAPPVPAMLPPTQDEALQYALAHHPSLGAARYLSKSAAYDVAAQKGSLYPDVEGELSYLKSEKADLIGGELVDGRAVVHLNWNLETGGAQLARIRQSKYEHAQALSKAREAERNVDLGVRLAWSEYQTAKNQLDNLERRRALNEKLFSTYKVQFEGAKISLLQLMQADNQLFTAGLEKINGTYRLLAAEYGLLAATGQIGEALHVAAAPNPLTHAAE